MQSNYDLFMDINDSYCNEPNELIMELNMSQAEYNNEVTDYCARYDR